MSTCPTVRIKFDEKGYEAGIIINQSDFNPKVHELHASEKPAVKLGRPPGTESVLETGPLAMTVLNFGKPKRARKAKK